MKRVVGTVLFGLGVLFLVLAVGLPVYVAPTVTKLPYDLARSTSQAEAKGATFLQVVEGKPTIHTNKDLISTTNVVPRPDLTNENQKLFNDGAVVWDVYSSTTRVDNKQKISESTTELALDRVSGVPVEWKDAWIDDGVKSSPKFAGQIYKFPFDTEKKDYPFWDGELVNASISAKFDGVDTIGGLEVYRFKQIVPWTKTATDDTSRKVLISNFAPTATTGDVWYRNTRTLWVEPATGAYLRVREEREQEFRDDKDGKTTLLRADFNYTQATIDNSVKNAKENKTKLDLISLYLPIGLGVVGLILVIAGPLMLRRRSYVGDHAEDL